MGYKPKSEKDIPHLDQVTMKKFDVVVKLYNSDAEPKVLGFYAGYLQVGDITRERSILQADMLINAKPAKEVESSMRWLEEQEMNWFTLSNGLIVKGTENLNRDKVPLLNDTHYKSVRMWGGALRSRYLRETVRHSWEHIVRDGLPRLAALRLADDLVHNDVISHTWLCEIEAPRHSSDTCSVDLVGIEDAKITAVIDSSPGAKVAAEKAREGFRYMWMV
jgi:hypothetical protein